MIFNTFIRHTRYALPRISVNIVLFEKPSEVDNYSAFTRFFSSRIVYHAQKPPSTSFPRKKNFFWPQNFFQDFFARAQKFSNFFRTTKSENLTRPDDFRTPHGRPTTRFKILRRGLKILGRAPKFSSRATERNMPPELGVLKLGPTSENKV